MMQNERLARLEEKVDNVAEKLDELIGGLDDRYAPKWVGDVVKGLVAICLVLVFTVGISGNFIKKDTTQTVTVTTQNPDGTITTTKKVETVPASSSTNSVSKQSSTPGQTTTTQTNPGSQSQNLTDVIKNALHL